MKKKIIIFFAALAVVTSVFAIRANITEACCVSLFPNPSGYVPNYILNTLRKADEYNYTPAFVAWISERDNYANQNVKVNAGAPSVKLSFSYAGAIGWQPSQATRSRATIHSASNSSGLAGKSLNLDWTGDINGNGRSDHTEVGTYRHTGIGEPFVFSPPGGFTRSGEYTVAVQLRHVNEFTGSGNNKVYECIIPEGYPNRVFVNSLNDVDKCPLAGTTLSFNITIENQRYDHRAEIRLLSGSPTDGEVSPGQTYTLYPRVSNVGSGITIDTHTLAVRNVPDNEGYVLNVNGGMTDLTPAAYRSSVFGVHKNYLTQVNECSSGNSGPRDCWLWLFKEIPANGKGDASFKFRVKNDAPDGKVLCFTPFVRRMKAGANGLYYNGEQKCFTVKNDNFCPADSDFPGQLINSQPDRNSDGEINREDCYIPPDQTYLRVYGNDIQAGGGFAPSCSVVNGNASVEGFSKSTTLGGATTWTGSSGQFAVSALGVVDGFFSSNMRGAESAIDFARPPVGQTFGNTDNMTTKVSINSGGDSGVQNCIPDYAAGVPVETGSNVISTRSVSGKQALVFENRDVFVTGTGIRFQGADTGWTTIDDIPSFYLIVKGGNIYINPSVTQLDGVYIAQPAADGTKGEIITCATAAGVVPGHGGCGQQLVINGAFIARQVQFKRVFGKLTEATAGEAVADTKAAEVFNFSPEVYLSPLNDSLKRSIPFTKYDYITSLPPIL